MKLWDFYLWALGRPAFAPVHTALLKVALRGLGFQAWWSPRVSGEEWVIDRLAIVSPQARILDIGANVGAYAALVRAKAPRARVLALEPNPETFKLLAGRAKDHGFDALNLGAGKMVGNATLYHRMSDSTSPHASLHASVLGNSTDVASHTISVTTIDRIVQDHDIENIEFLKIDTEGSELDVLLGAQNSIQSGKIDWVQFEFNTMNSAARVFFEDFQAVLPGYRFYRLLSKGVIPVGDSPWSLPNLFMYQNLLAVRPGAPAP